MSRQLAGTGTRLDRCQRIFDARERHDPVGRHDLRQLLRHGLGQGRDDGSRTSRSRCGRCYGVASHMPIPTAAQIGPRKVQDQHGYVVIRRHHGGKGPGQHCLIAPMEGVVVERVGNGHQGRQSRCDPLGLRRVERPKVESGPSDRIGHQRGLAARATHGRDSAAR